MAASGKRGTWRIWCGRLILLAISGALALLTLEFLIRIFLPLYHPNNQFLFQRNDQGVVLGPPSTTQRLRNQKGDFDVTVRINQHGFRDANNYDQSRPDDVFVAGDSYSFGWGVEEAKRYSSGLERKTGVRIFNIAIPEDIRGYARTVDFIERKSVRIRNLVIGLCMENDLWDYSSTANTHELFRKHVVRGVRQELALWCRTRSALWICLSYTVQQNTTLRRIAERIGISRNIDQLTHKNSPTPEILNSSRDELVKIATNYNSVILIIPSRALWQGNNTNTEAKAHENLTRMLMDAGLDLVDMKPIFEATGDPSSFYFKNDPHWNEKGHAFATDALAGYISRSDKWRQLLPAKPDDSKR